MTVEGADFLRAALLAVATFSDFDPDNDPHQEHDFGAVDVAGRELFWKIDYFDDTMTIHAEAPSDPTACTRVLTIMLAEEY